MFIRTEETPNPNSLKFIPGHDVMGEKAPININSLEEARISVLAEMLFKFDFVKSVFLGSDFITVTKIDNITWDIIKPDILVTIMEFYVSNLPIIKSSISPNSNLTTNENDSEIVKQIKEIIENQVRPAVALDGGDIIFKSFENGTVFVELHGACSGCPSSTITLKNGIESMLRHYIPEVKYVEAV